MKKILSFIIIIAMTLSLGVPAFAATPATVTVASPAAAVNPGSTVDVAVNIANNPGMDVMKLKFSYDTAALTLKDMELGSVMTGTFTKNLDKAVALLEAAGTTNATGNGTLVTLKFEVKSTATAGNYTIDFLVADAVNRDEERVALTTQAGTVSVVVPVTTYTVKFNANGGTGTMADVTGVPAGAYTLPANGFTAPAGKQFKGWSTGASGAVIEGTTYNVTGDVTLYAIWEDKPHTHTYSTEWSSDETNHWHECTCGDKKDVAAHTYDNACDTTCNVCGKTRETSHSFGSEWYKNSEKHWHECSVCHTRKDEAAHIPGAEATETTAQTCTVCGYVIKAPLGHTHRPTIVKRVEPTCEKAGNIEHYKCSCGKLYYDAAATKEITNAAKIILSATGHTRGGDWKTSEIYHWHECAVCGERMDTAFHRAGAEATETTPQTCAVCGYVIKEALGHTHSFTEKNTDAKYLKSAATCSASAEYYYSCSCGEKGTETFKSGEKLAHNFKTEWPSNGEKHWHECSLCGEKKEESSHSFEWKIDKAATATEAGSKHEECTVCGFKKDAVTIEPTGTTTTTPDQTTTDDTTETPEKSGNAWILIVVAGVAVLGGGAAATVVAVKKKKEN